MSFYLGYNTNGLAHHSLAGAIQLLKDVGYQGIAITLDHACLNPFDPHLEEHINRTRDQLQAADLRCVIETGARFLLDPLCKHEPTIVTADERSRKRRIDFLLRAIDIASTLGADCVSLWSGVVHDRVDRGTAWEEPIWDRLLDAMRVVIEHAEAQNVRLGFEPEPDMFIDTMDRYRELLTRLGDDRLKLTLDVGHLWCQQELPLDKVLLEWRDQMVNVHLEDMKAGVHEHLMFGEGEIDFSEVLSALGSLGYEGGVFVELSRHSHQAVQAATEAYAFLEKTCQAGRGENEKCR